MGPADAARAEALPLLRRGRRPVFDRDQTIGVLARSDFGIPKEDTMKAKITWILIADGAQAKVFEHAGPGKGLRIIDGLQFEQEPLQAREIMADRPGNSIGSQGARNSGGVEYSSDPVAVRERRFVENVAEELEKRLQKGEFERLIVAAAPTALGDLRPVFSKALKETIVGELPKDLTNIPTPKLETHFADLLAV